MSANHIKKNARHLLILTVVLLMVFSLTLAGCGNNTGQNGNDDDPPPDYTVANTALERYLPDDSGFTWRYDGSYEYGHSMTLTASDRNDDVATYQITGEVDDPSGGEAGGPERYVIDLRYVVQEGKLIQQLDSEMMRDTPYKDLTLLQHPVEEGSTWEQEVVDEDGNSTTIKATVVEVNNEDSLLTTVRYEDLNSRYYEERVFQEGAGVVRFTKLYMDDKDTGDFELSYWLFRPESELTAFFPPVGEELRYHGLAEYGHVAQVTSVDTSPGRDTYLVEGTFEDGSGLGGTFEVSYVHDLLTGSVTEIVISNSRKDKAEINSLLHDPIILQTPLTDGAQWQQAVTINGAEYTMTATITDTATVEVNGESRQEVRVEYRVPGVPGYYDTTYIERRTFVQGLGMTGFSSLFKEDMMFPRPDNLTVEEWISQNMFGYGLNANITRTQGAILEILQDKEVPYRLVYIKDPNTAEGPDASDSHDNTSSLRLVDPVNGQDLDIASGPMLGSVTVNPARPAVAYLVGDEDSVSGMISIADDNGGEDIQFTDSAAAEMSYLAWSPNGRFLVHDEGTDVWRTITIYDLDTRAAYQFDRPVGSILWSPDSTKIAYTVPEEVDPPIMIHSGESISIEVLDLTAVFGEPTGSQGTPVAVATGTTDYMNNAVAWKDGNTLIFVREGVADSSQAYFGFDLITGATTSLEDYTPPTQTGSNDYRANLPDSLRNKPVVFSPAGEFGLISIREKGQAHWSLQLWISGSDNIVDLGQGRSAYWLSR